MPCDKHTHASWPRNGAHRLLIESCENKCGWCDYKNPKANNLRVHAWRHIKNPQDESLKAIVIVACKAGRGRVTINRPPSPASSADHLPPLDDEALGDELTSLQRSEAALRKLHESHHAVLDECVKLRDKNTFLEKILRDRGIGEADLYANTETGSHQPEQTHAESYTLEESRPLPIASTSSQPFKDDTSQFRRLSNTTNRLKLKVVTLHTLLNLLVDLNADSGFDVPYKMLRMQNACALLPTETDLSLHINGRSYVLSKCGIGLVRIGGGAERVNSQVEQDDILKAFHALNWGSDGENMNLFRSRENHPNASDEAGEERLIEFNFGSQPLASKDTWSSVQKTAPSRIVSHDKKVPDNTRLVGLQPAFPQDTWQENSGFIAQSKTRDCLNDTFLSSWRPVDSTKVFTELRPQPLEPSIDRRPYNGGSSLNTKRIIDEAIDTSRGMIAPSQMAPITVATFCPPKPDTQSAETRAQGHLHPTYGSQAPQAATETSQQHVPAYDQNPHLTVKNTWHPCRVPGCDNGESFHRAQDFINHLERMHPLEIDTREKVNKIMRLQFCGENVEGVSSSTYGHRVRDPKESQGSRKLTGPIAIGSNHTPLPDHGFKWDLDALCQLVGAGEAHFE